MHTRFFSSLLATHSKQPVRDDEQTNDDHNMQRHGALGAVGTVPNPSDPAGVVEQIWYQEESGQATQDSRRFQHHFLHLRLGISVTCNFQPTCFDLAMVMPHSEGWGHTP